MTHPGGTRARRAARGEVEAAPTTSAPDPGDRAADTSAAPARTGRSGLDPDLLAALEEERDFLLRSLADLEREHDAGDVDDADYAALKDDYTARAAGALRGLEEHRARVEAARPRRSPARALVVTALVVVGALGAGWLVMTTAGERAPGDGITGGIRESSIDELTKASEYISRAQAALQEGDGEAAVDAYRDAIDAYDRALELQPDNVEAMTYRGWLLHNLALQAGGGDAGAQLDATALEWLGRAVDTDPGYPDARIFRAMLLEDQGRVDEALADLDAVDPATLPAAMTEMVSGLRARLEAATAPGAPTSVAGG